MRHFLDGAGAMPDGMPGPALDLALFLGAIVAWVTSGRSAADARTNVAGLLGFRYVNDEIIDRAAEHAGVSRREVAEVERSPSLIRRIMTAMGSAPLSEFGAGLLAAEEIDASPSYRRLIQEVIREVAAQGNVVILAHGASIL